MFSLVHLASDGLYYVVAACGGPPPPGGQTMGGGPYPGCRCPPSGGYTWQREGGREGRPVEVGWYGIYCNGDVCTRPGAYTV